MLKLKLKLNAYEVENLSLAAGLVTRECVVNVACVVLGRGTVLFTVGPRTKENIFFKF